MFKGNNKKNDLNRRLSNVFIINSEHIRQINLIMLLTTNMRHNANNQNLSKIAQKQHQGIILQISKDLFLMY